MSGVVRLVVPGVLAAATPSPAVEHPVFSDITAIAGVTTKHTPPANVQTSPMLSGGAAGDFNRDGWQDLFVVGGGGAADRLFINNGDGSFTDLAQDWNVAVKQIGGGIAVGDYDNDGWLDVFVASHGSPAGKATGVHRLYRNTGAGFEEVAEEAGVETTSLVFADGYGASWGDYDVDGDLDLFVCGWIYLNQGNRLFRNEGDGTFADVTAQAIDVNLELVHGFSPRFADMDGDRLPELLIAADFQTSRYYVNAGDGTFLDLTFESGTGLDSNGMGSALGDVNNDGLLDWYVTSIETDGPGGPIYSGNMLYLNQGRHAYAEESIQAGVNQGGWGWGADTADFDNDGDLDIVETNGWVDFQWDRPRYLWSNNGDGTFTEVGEEAGIGVVDQGRGLLTLDCDNDGDLDLVTFAIAEPMAFYRNDTPREGANWLRVDLSNSGDPRVAPDGYGALVRVSVGEAILTRVVSPGSTYLSQSDLRVFFGLGEATSIDELRVMWPDGRDTVLEDVPANTTLAISGCRADVSGDGVVNIFDAVAFQLAFAAGEEVADFDEDGGLTILDFVEFVELLQVCAD